MGAHSGHHRSTSTYSKSALLLVFFAFSFLSSFASAFSTPYQVSLRFFEVQGTFKSAKERQTFISTEIERLNKIYNSQTSKLCLSIQFTERTLKPEIQIISASTWNRFFPKDEPYNSVKLLRFQQHRTPGTVTTKYLPQKGIIDIYLIPFEAELRAAADTRRSAKVFFDDGTEELTVQTNGIFLVPKSKNLLETTLAHEVGHFFELNRISHQAMTFVTPSENNPSGCVLIKKSNIEDAQNLMKPESDERQILSDLQCHCFFFSVHTFLGLDKEPESLTCAIPQK